MNKKADMMTTVSLVIGFILVLAFTVLFLFSKIDITGMVSAETDDGEVEATDFGVAVMIVLIGAIIFLVFTIKRAHKIHHQPVKRKKVIKKEVKKKK